MRTIERLLALLLALTLMCAIPALSEEADSLSAFVDEEIPELEDFSLEGAAPLEDPAADANGEIAEPTLPEEDEEDALRSEALAPADLQAERFASGSVYSPDTYDVCFEKKNTKVSLSLYVGDRVNIYNEYQGYYALPLTAKSWKNARSDVASLKPVYDEYNGDYFRASAVGVGKTTVTVKTYEGYSLSLKLTVKDPYVPDEAWFDEPTVRLALGKQQRILPNIFPECARTTYTWKSSSNKVAEVAANGTVTANKVGKAKITAKTANGKKATYTVEVYDPTMPTSVSLNATSMTVVAGKSVRLTPTVSPGTAIPGYTWKSSNKKVAVVSDDGLVTTLKSGTVKITVTTRNKKKAVCTIKVLKGEFEGRSELTKYLGTSVKTVAKKLKLERETGYDSYVYASDGIEVAGPKTGYMYLFWDSQKKYAMGGVCLGMTEAQARAALAANGWKWNSEFEDYRKGKYYLGYSTDYDTGRVDSVLVELY